MQKRWKQRPSWLNGVHTNPSAPEPVKSRAKVKVYLGHLETLSWKEFLKAAEFSVGEPALLEPSAINNYQPPQKPRGLPWRELVRQVGWTEDGLYHYLPAIADIVHAPTNKPKHITWNQLVHVSLKWDDLLSQTKSNLGQELTDEPPGVNDTVH